MSTTVALLAEVQAAQAFLKALGAPWHNTDLIYAVVAWMRSESGAITNVIGNNPFNLRPGKDIDADLIAGIRKTRNNNGYFLVFKSLEAGLIATAQRLMRAGHDWRKYDAIVNAFKEGHAVEALNAIALSAWNVSHYGYDSKDPATNHIYLIYARFTGLQLPKPTSTKPKPKPQPKPQRPRDLNAPIVVRNYIDPHHAGEFYRAKHKHSNILTD